MVYIASANTEKDFLKYIDLPDGTTWLTSTKVVEEGKLVAVWYKDRGKYKDDKYVSTGTMECSAVAKTYAEAFDKVEEKLAKLYPAEWTTYKQQTEALAKAEPQGKFTPPLWA